MRDSIDEKVEKLFAEGYRCAESVLLIAAQTRGISSEWIPKIAAGFCGGMSRTRGTCGAVTGAVLSLNLFFGRPDPSVPLEASYLPVQQFLRQFEAAFGSTNCFDLIGCDLATEEGRKKFLDENKLPDCKHFTACAARWALEVIGTKE